MKATILGVMSAIVATVGFAMPAGAVFGGGSVAGNGSITSSGYTRMGVSITDAGVKAYFVGEQVTCMKSSVGSLGGFTFGNTTPVKVEPTTLPSATPDANCVPEQAVNNPSPAATVTINNVCGDPAELARLMREHTNLIINSVGPCPSDDAPVDTTKPAPVATVVVTEPAVVTAAATNDAPAANPKGGAAPAELPQTGASDYVLAAVAAGLAVATYAGVLLVRNTRRA